MAQSTNKKMERVPQDSVCVSSIHHSVLLSVLLGWMYPVLSFTTVSECRFLFIKKILQVGSSLPQSLNLLRLVMFFIVHSRAPYRFLCPCLFLGGLRNVSSFFGIKKKTLLEFIRLINCLNFKKLIHFHYLGPNSWQLNSEVLARKQNKSFFFSKYHAHERPSSGH